MAKVLEQGNEELKKVFSRRIITVGWYPYKAYADFSTIVDRLMGKGTPELCREIGKFAANRDMKTTYNINKERAKPIQLVRDSEII